MFPIKISYFQELKSKFEGQLPTKRAGDDQQIYGSQQSQVKTQSELIQWLIHRPRDFYKASTHLS